MNLNDCMSIECIYIYELEHFGEKIRVGAQNEGDRRRLRGSSHVLLRRVEDSF